MPGGGSGACRPGAGTFLNLHFVKQSLAWGALFVFERFRFRFELDAVSDIQPWENPESIASIGSA